MSDIVHRSPGGTAVTSRSIGPVQVRSTRAERLSLAAAPKYRGQALSRGAPSTNIVQMPSGVRCQTDLYGAKALRGEGAQYKHVPGCKRHRHDAEPLDPLVAWPGRRLNVWTDRFQLFSERNHQPDYAASGAPGTPDGSSERIQDISAPQLANA